MSVQSEEEIGVLTDRQAEIYEWIYTRTMKQGYQPTLTEIGQQFGIKSAEGVNRNLNRIAKKGYIELHEGRARAIGFVLNPFGEPFRGFREF